MYDGPGDRDNAMSKILRIQPHRPNTEFVIIVLPIIGLPLLANPNLGASSTTAILKVARPSIAPYLGH